jgi:CHAT domain-containing protein/tetratricopeptide (TPR) repeat protein
MDPVNDLGCQYVEEHDLVSAYLGERLSEQEAEAFERHFFGCERCWGEVKAGEEIRAALRRGGAGGAAAAAAPSSIIRQGPWTTPRVLMLAAAVAIAAAGAALLWRPGARAPQSGIALLADAAGARRTTQARLAGPFRYGPITRGSTSVETELSLAMREAIDRARKDPSAENLHAAGVAYLLANDSKSAVEALGKASEKAPRDAAIESDLAAAYLTRGADNRDREDFARAYEAAGKALELDPSSTAARFNSALALEGLGERAQAQKAWEAYVSADPKSGWADEARARLQALSAPPRSELWRRERERLEAGLSPNASAAQDLARRFPQQVRQYVEDELLPSWGEAASTESSARALALGRALAQGLAETNGERLGRDAVAAIDDAERSRDAAALARLRDAHRRFGEARTRYKAAEIAEATEIFRGAEKAADGSGSPIGELARLGEASCHLYGASARESAPLVETLSADVAARGSGWPALHGQTLWLDGLVEGIEGHPYESLESYRKALAIFQRLGESENVAGLHGGIGGQLKVLGRSDEAWSHYIAQLEGLDEGAPTARLTNAHGDVVRESLGRGYTRLALLSDAEEVRISDARKAPLFMTYSRLWRAQTAERLGDLRGAAADLAAARAKAAEISDAGTRERAEAEIDLGNVRIAGRGDPAEAFASADRAVAAADRAENRGRLPELLWVRGKLHRELGRTDLALRDFLRGIDALESARREIAPADLRISYFETSRSLFDGAIGLLVAAGRDEEAFLLADRAHGRAVLDSVRRAGTKGSADPAFPLTVEHVRERLDPDTALVEYWVSDARSEAWVVRRDLLARVTLPIGTAAAESSVSRLLKQLEQPRAEGADASSLYEAIIRPLAPHLQGAANIAFVPDGPLHALPFAVLRDSTRSRLLVEDYASWIAPSAAYLVASPKTKPLGRTPRVLVIANPAFDRTRFPDLPPLAGADAEADAILSVFPSATVLRGKDATKAAFLRLAPQYDIVHFAGHAIVDDAHPEYSALIFALDPTPGRSSLLYAHELSELDLRRARLIVLAGCDSAAGKEAAGEGLLSLSHGILASGAKSVIGSSASIRDLDMAAVAVAIYVEASMSTNFAQALRSAQLQRASTRHDNGSRWAAFEITGF